MSGDRLAIRHSLHLTHSQPNPERISMMPFDLLAALDLSTALWWIDVVLKVAVGLGPSFSSTSWAIFWWPRRAA